MFNNNPASISHEITWLLLLAEQQLYVGDTEEAIVFWVIMIWKNYTKNHAKLLGSTTESETESI